VNFEKEAALALKAVSEGARIVGDRPERVSVTTKQSFRDVVTEFDKKIERRVGEILAESGYPVVGEESFDETSAREPSGMFWAVDPIDGTANFVAGIPYYGISVGLVRGGTDARVGAVALPALRELYFTHGDEVAFRNGKALPPIDRRDLAQSLVAGGFAGPKGDEKERALLYKLFGELNDRSRGALRLGSAAANLCYVASGQLQVAYGFNASIWDVAGGLAIAGRAGCVVRCARAPGKARVHYLAGGETAVSEALEVIRKVGLGEAFAS
jgi:myo-inositol-1(or 4)-monophosphatase